MARAGTVPVCTTTLSLGKTKWLININKDVTNYRLLTLFIYLFDLYRSVIELIASDLICYMFRSTSEAAHDDIH